WSFSHTDGPVLSQTDLFLLKPTLILNPVLTKSSPYNLVFDIATGAAGGYNESSADRELEFSAAQREEPATLPRVTHMYIITADSPWCTTVINPNGVTLGDVCNTLWHDYADNPITEAELAACPPRVQETIKRYAQSSMQPYGQIYSPAPNRLGLKRIDWLRDRHMFDLIAHDRTYADERLGFHAPNTFTMRVVNY
ncbi:hypothetical protein OF83DRAFT_1063934, partial [Amylostereum chailletii]